MNEHLRIDLREYQPEGATVWDLPMWTHPLSQGIFPLCVHANDHLFPIGTAFVISRLGFVATAEHNLREALKHHWNGPRLRGLERLPNGYHLSDVGLSILHHRLTEHGNLEINVWPIEGVQGPPPTDLLFGWPKFSREIPRLSSTLSFAVPRVGSTVHCVGYAEMRFPANGIPVEDLKSGKFDPISGFSYKLRVVEATVTRVFTRQFARRFIEGPCFVINAEVDHGLSGGPVINEDGNVCGVVSAGATSFFGEPASIISLLYPSLLTELEFGAELGVVNIRSKQPMISLVSQGSIRTDGSEQLVGFTPDEDGFSLGPLIRRGESESVHDDFSAYQENREATRETRQAWRLRRTD